MQYVLIAAVAMLTACAAENERLRAELDKQNQPVGPNDAQAGTPEEAALDAANSEPALEAVAKTIPVLKCRLGSGTEKHETVDHGYRFDYRVDWSDLGVETYMVAGLHEAKCATEPKDGHCWTEEGEYMPLELEGLCMTRGGRTVPADIVTQTKATKPVDLWYVTHGVYTKTPPTVSEGQPVPPPDFSVFCKKKGLKRACEPKRLKQDAGVVAVNR